MLIFPEERSRVEAGLIELYCSGVMSCEKSAFIHFKLTFLHLYCVPLSSCLQTLPLLPFFLSSLQNVSPCLKIPLVAGGKVSRQLSFVALSGAWLSAASPPTPSPSRSPPSLPRLPPASEILSSPPCLLPHPSLFSQPGRIGADIAKEKTKTTKP